MVVVAAQRLGGDEAPPAPPPKERKTISITIPEGYSRDQVAAVAKKAGLKGDYMKATESFKGFDPAKYGADGPREPGGLPVPRDLRALQERQGRGPGRESSSRRSSRTSHGIDLSYAKSKNLTTYDVVKIASMIEREVQVPEERATSRR